jgi:copper homeostasis protein
MIGITMSIKIEVCVDNILSLIKAQNAGADRIELCASLSEGGLTPSYGMLKEARKLAKIPVFVMLRPRRGNFIYTDHELEIMLHDIDMIKSLGFDGIVSGCLSKEAEVNTAQLKILVEYTQPLSFSFHRAFDFCLDPYKSLETLIDCGVQRVLTSGQKTTAIKGKECIQGLIKHADNRIIIMPGSGINDKNFSQFHDFVRASEYHLSASEIINSEMRIDQTELNMGSSVTLLENQLKITNEEIIKQIKKECK